MRSKYQTRIPFVRSDHQMQEDTVIFRFYSHTEECRFVFRNDFFTTIHRNKQKHSKHRFWTTASCVCPRITIDQQKTTLPYLSLYVTLNARRVGRCSWLNMTSTLKCLTPTPLKRLWRLLFSGDTDRRAECERESVNTCDTSTGVKTGHRITTPPHRAATAAARPTHGPSGTPGGSSL